MVILILSSALNENNYLEIHVAALVQRLCNWQRNHAPQIYVHSLIIKLLDLILILILFSKAEETS